MELNLKAAWKLIHGLSEPSKMPCYSYNIPAKKCITGAKLRQIKGSVCSVCYAFKGNYGFPVVRNALMKRYKSLKHPKWVEGMTISIRAMESSGYFRFFDSGDIQGLWHLAKICQIARNLPDIKFWLPTREYGIVSEYLKTNTFPENLTVRLSAYMLEGEPPVALAKRLNLATSGVVKEGFTCPASLQGNKCLSCRVCWDKSTPNVNYHKH